MLVLPLLRKEHTEQDSGAWSQVVETYLHEVAVLHDTGHAKGGGHLTYCAYHDVVDHLQSSHLMTRYPGQVSIYRRTPRHTVRTMSMYLRRCYYCIGAHLKLRPSAILICDLCSAEGVLLPHINLLPSSFCQFSHALLLIHSAANSG